MVVTGALLGVGENGMSLVITWLPGVGLALLSSGAPSQLWVFSACSHCVYRTEMQSCGSSKGCACNCDSVSGTKHFIFNFPWHFICLWQSLVIWRKHYFHQQRNTFKNSALSRTVRVAFLQEAGKSFFLPPCILVSVVHQRGVSKGSHQALPSRILIDSYNNSPRMCG